MCIYTCSLALNRDANRYIMNICKDIHIDIQVNICKDMYRYTNIYVKYIFRDTNIYFIYENKMPIYVYTLYC